MPDLARTAARAVALALISSLMVLGFGLSSPAQAMPEKGKVHPEWGSTATKAHILKRSCRNYRYSYSLNPPEGNWALETFLVGPGGVNLSSGAIAIGFDPEQGHDKFRFCRPSTRPGIFRIRARLSVQDDSGKNYREGWLPVTKFRLRLPR